MADARNADPVVVTPALLRGWPLPSAEGDKGSKGRLVVIGGSDGTPGAVRLAAEAALRVGAGKVQVGTIASAAAALATAAPECLVAGLEAQDGDIAPSEADRLVEMAEGADAVLLGPGVSSPQAARDLLALVVPRLDTTVAVDAVGTAYLTEHPDGLRHLASRALLTPNVDELGHVVGRDADEVERDLLGAARAAAEATGATVLAGADESYVVEPSGAAWVLEAGVSGAAVAGSGDVKAGTVAGLLARGATPAQAAVWGGYLHRQACVILAASVGPVGFLAREMTGLLPRALAEVAG